MLFRRSKAEIELEALKEITGANKPRLSKEIQNRFNLLVRDASMTAFALANELIEKDCSSNLSSKVIQIMDTQGFNVEDYPELKGTRDLPHIWSRLNKNINNATWKARTKNMKK